MRGFAQTVHCPRCGAAKPMGAERVPIVTCGACGLGFDPKPREPARREVALVPAAQSLVREDVDDTAAQLVVRDSVFGGVWFLLVAFACAFFAYLAIGVSAWVFVPITVGVALASLYAGASHVLGKTIVYVSADTIAAYQRPLPRFRQRVITGEVAAVASKVRASATGLVTSVWVAEASGDGRMLVDAHDELATELVELIRKHRARLGAPVREPGD
jgi:hypothetical protein